MRDVIVLGAGISGLSIGVFLTKTGHDVLILEAEEKPGGVISTLRKDGFLLELGPNSNLGKEAFLGLCKTLALEDSLLYPAESAKKRFLAKRLRNGTNKIIPVPMGPLQAIFTPLLSFPGKLRILLEPFVPRTSKSDEEVYSFISRRLGKEAAQEIVAPALNGIWAADYRQLSTRSSLPKLWEMEQSSGSLLRGAIRAGKEKRKSGATRARAKLTTFHDGLSEIAHKAASFVGNEGLLLGTRVSAITPTTDGYKVSVNTKDGTVQEHLARKVVCSLPADCAAELIQPLNTDLASHLRAIPYAPLGMLHLACRKEDVAHPLDGFGFLVPPSLDFALLGVIFSSSLFAGRAPDEYHLLTCFVGGASRPEFADVRREEIVARVIRELRSCIPLENTPRVLLGTYWPRAIPNYTLGHHQTLEQAAAFCRKHPGFHFLSSFQKGISVSDRVAAAAELAEELNTLNSRARTIRENKNKRCANI